MMKIHDLIDAEWLKITDLENMFSLYRTQNGDYMFNINDAIYIGIDRTQLLDYTCDRKMHWPLISYNVYGSTRLAWLLMKINEVPADDMFKAVDAAETIKYIDPDFVQTIVKSINDYGDN